VKLISVLSYKKIIPILLTNYTKHTTFVHCAPVVLAARRRLTNCDSISCRVRIFHYSMILPCPLEATKTPVQWIRVAATWSSLKLDARLDVALGLRIYCKVSCSGA